jgi:hypothetical protein
MELTRESQEFGQHESVPAQAVSDASEVSEGSHA